MIKVESKEMQIIGDLLKKENEKFLKWDLEEGNVYVAYFHPMKGDKIDREGCGRYAEFEQKTIVRKLRNLREVMQGE